MSASTFKAAAVAAVALFSFAIAPATGTASVSGAPTPGPDGEVAVTPNPATPGEQLVATGFCEYYEDETFVAALGAVGGTDFPLQADGPPVPGRAGFLRQNLTGAPTAPGTPGTYHVGSTCDTAERSWSVQGSDLVVNEPTTTTTTTTTTTSTPGAPTTTSVPSTTQAPLALTG